MCNRCRCSSPGTSSRPRPTSSMRGSRCPGTKRLLRRRHRELQVMVGYSDSAKEAGVLAANLELYRAQRSMAAWAPGARRASHDLPRARGRARARRRPGQPGDPRPTAGLGRRPVHGHRAGRDGVRALRRPDARPPPPRAARRARSCGRARPATQPDPADRFERELDDAWPRRRAPGTSRSCDGPGLRAVLPAGDADRADLDAADRIETRRERRRATPTSSTTCGRSRGCSRGDRAA